MSGQELRIGQLAEATGVEAPTLRYYEKRGVLDSPRRSSGGYRLYPPEAVGRVRFVRTARDLGFSLESTRELIRLRADDRSGAGRVRELARRKLEDVRRKLDDLQRIESTLDELVRRCDGEGGGRDCCILDALESKAGGS